MFGAPKPRPLAGQSRTTTAPGTPAPSRIAVPRIVPASKLPGSGLYSSPGCARSTEEGIGFAPSSRVAVPRATKGYTVATMSILIDHTVAVVPITCDQVSRLCAQRASTASGITRPYEPTKRIDVRRLDGRLPQQATPHEEQDDREHGEHRVRRPGEPGTGHGASGLHRPGPSATGEPSGSGELRCLKARIFESRSRRLAPMRGGAARDSARVTQVLRVDGGGRAARAPPRASLRGAFREVERPPRPAIYISAAPIGSTAAASWPSVEPTRRRRHDRTRAACAGASFDRRRGPARRA